MPISNDLNIKLITFDCYGTLVDWEQGLRNSLLTFDGVNSAEIDEIVQEYVRIEASLEQQAYQSYSDIQRTTLKLLGERFRFEVPVECANRLSDDIGDWSPFHDTVAALGELKTRYPLGILSNIDAALFVRTNTRLKIDFDLIVTAEDVRSYKPSHAHFLRAIEQTGLDRQNILHVAQSLYHDAKPAGALGIPFVWINRYNQQRPDGVEMLDQFPDLATFTNALLT